MGNGNLAKKLRESFQLYSSGNGPTLSEYFRKALGVHDRSNLPGDSLQPDPATLIQTLVDLGLLPQELAITLSGKDPLAPLDAEDFAAIQAALNNHEE